jgi:hypothetical protein
MFKTLENIHFKKFLRPLIILPHESSGSALLVMWRHNPEQLDHAGAVCRGEGGSRRMGEGECNLREK